MTRVRTVQQAETDWEKEFEAFFKASYPRAIAYLSKISGQEELAMDLCQDIFTSIWEKKIILPASPEEKLYYLFSIVRNSFYQHTRKTLREQRELGELQSLRTTTEISSSRLELSQQQNILWETLDEAPAEKRKYFLLNRDQGLTYKQIARQEGVSEKTVERYIGSILKTLRTRLTSFFTW